MRNKEYLLLVQEGHLTRSALIEGLNSIRKSNVDDNSRGLFYSGLFQLATGFERLMKIVFILDYKINNDFKNPSDKELRKFSHNIKELFDKCANLSLTYELKEKLNLDEFQSKILNVLSSFGTSSRYYNLTELAENNNKEDPIAQWLDVIDDHVWMLRRDVRENLQNIALSHGTVDSWCQHITGEPVTTIDFHYYLLSTEKANPYIIWSIIDMLRPFYGLLREQVRMLNKKWNKNESIPFIYEFFVFFLTKRNIVLKRRRWKIQ
ncbi:hypothetical protein [Salinivibrio kushneri]|uniref:Uncharacterized protein n=1 Tax=Salinivibrio kushneri TaxID=1908198 RepID=A0AA47KIT8_9GAMM|nr:hypothetical protein [Salinivibrio kushneri]WBA07676.1 hypothetical protein N8M53_07310 [Salinivibrio kushneri]